jgi:hypothetical protein
MRGDGRFVHALGMFPEGMRDSESRQDASVTAVGVLHLGWDGIEQHRKKPETSVSVSVDIIS